MNNFPKNEIKEVNELLHRLLGYGYTKFKIGDCELIFSGEHFIGNLTGNKTGKKETLKILEGIKDENYLKLYKFLNFYYPRWIAFNVIKDSDDKYAEFSSNNELFLALTSIIDSVSNDVWKNENEEINGYYTKKFKFFLNKYLSKSDIDKILKNYNVYKKQKTEVKLENIEDFGKYIYKIRSKVIHETELGGVYPYNTNLNFEKNISIILMITPEIFRKYLWKAILNYLGIRIIL